MILLCTFIHNVLTYLILRNKFGVADFIGFIWSRPSPSKNFFLGNIFYGYLYVFKRVGKKYWHIHPIFQVFFSFLSNSTEQRCMNCRELMKIHYIRCVLKHKSSDWKLYHDGSHHIPTLYIMLLNHMMIVHIIPFSNDEWRRHLQISWLQYCSLANLENWEISIYPEPIFAVTLESRLLITKNIKLCT